MTECSRARRVGLAVFIVLLMVIGAGIGLSPAPVQQMVLPILAILVCSVGAVRAGASAILCWRARRWSLALILLLLAVMLSVLVFALLGRLG